MSSKDTTADKLVASIRKTRAGSETPEKPASSTPSSTVKKAVTKKAPAKKAVAKASRSGSSAKPARKQVETLFNTGRRVWPD